MHLPCNDPFLVELFTTAVHATWRMSSGVERSLCQSFINEVPIKTIETHTKKHEKTNMTFIPFGQEPYA
jgi:hypothetical protein